jgi:hypothetical protein
MGPITFGMVSIGAAGGSLVLVAILKRIGLSINEEAIKVVLELSKYGGILYLLNHISKLFL